MNAPINATTTGLQCNQNRLYRFRPRAQPSVVLAKLLRRVNEPLHLMIFCIGSFLNVLLRECGLLRAFEAHASRLMIPEMCSLRVSCPRISNIYYAASYIHGDHTSFISSTCSSDLFIFSKLNFLLYFCNITEHFFSYLVF